LNPVVDGCATTAVLTRTHVLAREFALRFPHRTADPSDWVKLDAEEVKWFTEQKGVEEHVIQCPVGGMILWDSRTIHCIAGAKPNAPHWRYAVYTCYRPLSEWTPKQLKMRAVHMSTMRVTNHWGTKAFGEGNRYPGYVDPRKAKAARTPAVLTQRGKQLFYGAY
jgi:hypothetical protein